MEEFLVHLQEYNIFKVYISTLENIIAECDAFHNHIIDKYSTSIDPSFLKKQIISTKIIEMFEDICTYKKLRGNILVIKTDIKNLVKYIRSAPWYKADYNASFEEKMERFEIFKNLSIKYENNPEKLEFIKCFEILEWVLYVLKIVFEN